MWSCQCVHQQEEAEVSLKIVLMSWFVKNMKLLSVLFLHVVLYEYVSKFEHLFPSFRNDSPAPSSVLSGLSARSEKILQEWYVIYVHVWVRSYFTEQNFFSTWYFCPLFLRGFTDSHTAQLMLKRAQKMKSKKQQQKKFRGECVKNWIVCTHFTY